MRARIVAIECGTSRSVVGAFTPAADGELMLEEYALLPRRTDEGAQWPELPDTLRHGTRFAASPAPNLTLTKLIELPAVARAQQERVVRFEAAQAIPRPLEELCWDWMPSGDGGRRVQLSAMKGEAAETFAAEAAAAGVRLDAIVPRAAALSLALAHNYPEQRGAILAEVEQSTALLVRCGGDMAAVRLIGLPAMAPVPAGPGEPSGNDATVSGDDLRVRRLGAEMLRLAEEGRGAEETAPPPVLLLGGPDALDPEAVERCVLGAAARVERFDALRRVRIGRSASGAAALSHQFGAVVGTALAVAARGGGAVNLLPEARQRENVFRRNRGRWLVALGVAAATAAATVWGLRSAVGSREAQAVALGRELEPWRAAQRLLAERQRELETCQRELAVLTELERVRTGWATWLGEQEARLARHGDIWLERLEPAGEAARAVAGSWPGHNGAAGSPASVAHRLMIGGCALDPGGDGRRGLDQVRGLLREWAAAEGVAAVEEERFEPSESGLLRFSCVLVLQPEARP